MTNVGKIIKVSGPVVVAKSMTGSKMYELVKVGTLGLIGEIIELNEDCATIQVYEETSGIRPGEDVVPTGHPLSVQLGPGLIGSIYDGIQRPLDVLKEVSGNYISRGTSANALDTTKKWKFTPIKKIGEYVAAGDIIGEVKETNVITHKIMVPPNVEGEISDISKEGEYTLEDTIYSLSKDGRTEKYTMVQIWPVRIRRPISKKLHPGQPLITGQRVVDTFFPIAKGGTCAIPGGFGTGKTVLQHALAKWSDAQMVTYVGCGERGNEMADVLETFPKLKDPKSGESLFARTTLIANTSNMPVAAREASVYTGITIAEYYRDMGYDVSLMADSSSRWAEALREISGRLEEMPGEEGFPAYLSSKLASFYERAGRCELIGSDKRVGSITVTAAVSPPGGDFSEPVTQNTLRVVKVFWGLDATLADRRHFPSVNWLKSYSLYVDTVAPWWNENVGDDWKQVRTRAMQILEREDELREIVQLVGPDALPEKEKALLFAARVLREDFLQQNSFHEIDTYCSYKKQFAMISVILYLYDKINEAIDRGVFLKDIEAIESLQSIARLKIIPEDTFEDHIRSVKDKITKEFEDLIQKGGV